MTSFTVKVSVNNFKVDKSENLDNAFYVFWHDTSKKRKKSRFFGFWKKRNKTYSRTILVGCGTTWRVCGHTGSGPCTAVDDSALIVGSRNERTERQVDGHGWVDLNGSPPRRGRRQCRNECPSPINSHCSLTWAWPTTYTVQPCHTRLHLAWPNMPPFFTVHAIVNYNGCSRLGCIAISGRTP